MFNALARVERLIAAPLEGDVDDRREDLRAIAQLIEQGAERLSVLLSTYRILRRENPVALLPVYVPDFLDDLSARMVLFSDAGQIEMESVFQDHWFFDRELIGDCLVNALQNALRFARSHIVLRAAVEGDYFVFRVEDDGPGYPDVIPGVGDGSPEHTGLFLAAHLVALHRQHDRCGRVTFERSVEWGGAQFSIFLP
jgi:signal transduction histidine kinase